MPQFQIPQLRPNQVAIIIGVVGVAVVVIFAYFLFRKPTRNVGTPVSLAVWGTEPGEAMKAALLQYSALRPNVTATYTELDPATYRTKLIDALAAGEGPDVFTLPSSDIGMMEGKLTAAPDALNAAWLDTQFPKAVSATVNDGGKTWALPLSLDTLVLLYNRDLLDAAGIVSPPATWDDVVADVSRLAAIDDQGQIQRAAIALGGTSQSVRDAADIVILLMIQGGTALSNQAHSSLAIGDLGATALRFYAQFANPVATTYSWNDVLGDSFQQFADGKLAMLITYPSAVEAIKDRNAYVDARIAPVPQAKGGTPRSYGDFPTLAVSKRGTNTKWGWDLVQVMTTNKDIMTAYAQQTKRAAALTSVIGEQIKDPATTVAATQALQARSWFAWDGDASRTAIDNAISDIVGGTADSVRAAATLEQRLRSLIRQ